MAEPVSLAFSLLALGRSAAQTAKSLFTFGRTVSNAKARINELATEVDLFASLPNSLASLLQEDGSPFGPQLLKETDEQLEDCHAILGDIRKEMNGIDPKSLTVISRTKWYFREETVNLLRTRLETAKTSLTLRVVILNLAASLKWRRESVNQHYGDAAQFLESDGTSTDKTPEWVQASHKHHGQLFTGVTAQAAPSIDTSTRRKESCIDGMSAPEAVRFLLAVWTNVEDTSSLPKDLSRTAYATQFANDSASSMPWAQAESSTASWHAAPHSWNSRQSSGFSPWTGTNMAMPLYQDTSCVGSQYAKSGSLFPSAKTKLYENEGVQRERPSASFSRPLHSLPCEHGPCYTQLPSWKAGKGNGAIRIEHIGGREGPSVPVACILLPPWQNDDRSWMRNFSSPTLLNFVIRYDTFLHFATIPYRAAYFWQDQRTFSGLILGVHTLIRKVCQRLAESYRDLVVVCCNQHLGRGGKSVELNSQIENARRATTRIQDFRFTMYRAKKSQLNNMHEAPPHVTEGGRRRIEPWNWESEMARGYLDPSRYCIVIDFPDEHPGGGGGHNGVAPSSRSKSSALPPKNCRTHHHEERVRTQNQRGHVFQGCNVYL